MSSDEYYSLLAEYIVRLRHEKTLHGFSSLSLFYTLGELDRYWAANDIGITDLKKEAYEKWFDSLDHDNLSRKTIYAKAAAYRQLMIYLSRIGKPVFIPALPRENEHKFIPYIFTHKEIRLLFKASEQQIMRSLASKNFMFSMPAILRLLYSTGIRLGEALSLRNQDIDFEHKQIILNNTKNRHQRIVPVNQSLLAVLEQYVSYRNKLRCRNAAEKDAFFFVSNKGTQGTCSAVERWFKQLLRKAGIPYKGHFAGPRVHDLRHTACIHAMMKMTGQGVDLYTCLPVLSKFMGHMDVYATEHYLRLTQEAYPEVINQQAGLSSGIRRVITDAYPVSNLIEDEG